MAILVKAVPTFLMHVFAPVLGVCLAAWFVALRASAISGKRRSPRQGLGRPVWAGLFALALACTSLVGKGADVK